MIPGLGKTRIAVGSTPDNDVVLQGAGVEPHHGHIVKLEGQLVYLDNGVGASWVNGIQIAADQAVPFDFKTQIVLGSVPIPLAHPSIAMMLMSEGMKPQSTREFLIGRDASRATLVINHPAVSSQHAIVSIDQRLITDVGSTSGVYMAGKRIAAHTPVPFEPFGVITFGPVPVPIPLLIQIGHALAGGPAAPAGHAPEAPRKLRTVIGELDLADAPGDVITVGRTTDNHIVVPHAQVSSKHAQIMREGEQLFLVDKGSANGTFVRGQRIAPDKRIPVQNGEKVFIGPMPLVIQIFGQRINVIVEDQAEQWAGKPTYEIEAWDIYLEVPDREHKGVSKTLLDHVSFKALPGDMIALMGPSGAGKTTLLMTLNGYLPPTSGQVRINGDDLYSIYDALRGSIGYVPQDDLVHPELTVFEAVRYSAQFRLPPDYSDAEVDARVEQTLRDLGLESLRNLQIGKPEKKVLSGGQRKRVNIALELVTDPVIVFLDEPTSGLAADDTTALVSLLADLTKKTGKTIVMTIHQPAKDEFEKFNLALILGYGGIPVYFGPTGQSSYQFFQRASLKPGSARPIDNPRDMFDMLNVRERTVHEDMKRRDPNATRNLARLEASRQWRSAFFNNANPVYAQMFSGRRTVGAAQSARGIPHRADVALLRQLGLLVSRYWKVKVRDRSGAAIMFLQAPIIGVMLAFVFAKQEKSIPFWCLGALQTLAKKSSDASDSTEKLLGTMQVTADHTAAMFFVVVSCVWFGTSNAAREIVTERSIYLRERMVNLSLVNYVLSKFVILSLVCVTQCAILLSIVFVALGFEGGAPAFAHELLNMIAVSINATALGLLLSTLVASSEAAMALTPIALIPQVVLGGLMVPMTTNSMLKPLMFVMPARWGFEGAIAQERMAIDQSPAWLIDLKQPDLTSPSDFVWNGQFHCATAQVASDTLAGAWGFVEWDKAWLPSCILMGMAIIMLLMLFAALKSRDPV